MRKVVIGFVIIMSLVGAALKGKHKSRGNSQRMHQAELKSESIKKSNQDAFLQHLHSSGVNQKHP